jgi:prolyl oligopeptidase
MKKQLVILTLIIAIVKMSNAQEDNYQWLEDVDSQKSMEFVGTQNRKTIEILTNEKVYSSIYDRTLEILNSSDRIAFPSILGIYVYNFWKDKDHVRGIWRRCLLTSYLSNNYEWDILLDIDELSKKDNEKWVYKGVTGLYPNYDRFLVQLSKGGGDAVIVKEFDVNKKQFIEDGFFIDESKGSVSYVDENTLVVSSYFGEGTMTSSGYPKQVKLWKRGTSLQDAQLIFEGESTDVGTWGSVLRDGSKAYTFMSRGLTTFSNNKLVWMNNKIIKLELPDDCDIEEILDNQLIVQLKSDWKVNGINYSSGSLLSLNFNELLKGKKEIQTILKPDAFSSISQVTSTKTKLLVNLLTNVTGQLYIYSFTDGQWIFSKVDAPVYGSTSIVATDNLSDTYFFDFENFITPSTLYSADASTNTFKVYQTLPAYFDAMKYEVKQFKAKSKDGTMVPYFMIASKDLVYDGTNPTVVYAYGGFEISLSPYYNSTLGVSWLDEGGVYVLANIRGGGEFGPKWHQDGMKEKRQNVFDDLFAVSEDVINKKVTSSKHLGVMGGSNGGLLVGVAFTQRPDLYNAVVCQVPLLDMQRYNKLLAGASWMGEYGNPDVPQEWEYIKKYSPYQNLKENQSYPEVFFTTSTRDDRVHPGHARKMVAKMNDLGYKTFYYENIEGGHAGASTNEQSAMSNALVFSYLLMRLR